MSDEGLQSLRRRVAEGDDQAVFALARELHRVGASEEHERKLKIATWALEGLAGYREAPEEGNIGSRGLARCALAAMEVHKASWPTPNEVQLVERLIAGDFKPRPLTALETARHVAAGYDAPLPNAGRRNDHDLAFCGACGGTGIGDYPYACHACGGHGHG